MLTDTDTATAINWHWHPDVFVVLLLIQGAYLLGVGPLRRHFDWADSVDPRHVAAFSLGVLVIFIAAGTPLHELSEGYLFSAHMLQHVLLTLVAPPLLLLGTPGWLLRPLLRLPIVMPAARFLTLPLVAFVLFNVVFAIWHLPVLYDLTLGDHPIHIAEHLLFMGTALLMWWPILSPLPELPRLSYPSQMLYLFLLSVAQLPVFAVITFSDRLLYTGYAEAPRLWNLSALNDQQIGGIFMKVAGMLIFLLVLAIVFFRWFHHEAEQEQAPALTRRQHVLIQDLEKHLETEGTKKDGGAEIDHRSE
ncbi:MAG: cytochrome c oxidase assembly protein [Candidatus Bipolaricaulia bacterium]